MDYVWYDAIGHIKMRVIRGKHHPLPSSFDLMPMCLHTKSPIDHQLNQVKSINITKTMNKQHIKLFTKFNKTVNTEDEFPCTTL